MATKPTPIKMGTESISDTGLQDYAYVAQDFNSMKERAVRLLQQQFGDDFNDFVESDYGIMWIEVVSFLLDILSFKLDMQSNEVSIDTVTQSRNRDKLAKLVGYTPTKRSSATAKFSISVSQSYEVDITLAKRITVSRLGTDGQDITYELFPMSENGTALYDDNLVLPAGDTQILSCIGIEGTTQERTYTSDGSSFQSILIERDDTVPGYFRVWVNGKPWEEVDTFDPSTPREVFRVEYDRRNYPAIVFADNIRGLIPPNGSEIVIEYRVGGGSRGRIVSGFFNETQNVGDVYSDLVVPMSITNYQASTGGSDGETIVQSRHNIPQWVTAQDRAVTGEDYSFWANSYSSDTVGTVGKALAVLRNSGCAGNIVDVYLLETDGETFYTATDGLKSAVAKLLEAKKMLTDEICIKNGIVTYRDIFLGLSIPQQYRHYITEIESTVRSKMDELFDIGNWNFGDSLTKTDIIKALSDISEISQIDIVFLSAGDEDPEEITTKFYELLRPGTIEITFEVVG